MKLTEMVSTTPIAVEKTVRGDELRSLTSGNPGLILPLAYIPLLREDRVSSGNITVSVDMSETLYPLLNAVNLSVTAHLIPFLAFERFDGLDSFNRSYQGINEPASGSPIPFMPTMNFAKAAPFWRCMGVYWPEGQPINRAPVEAYNVLVNWRRQVRSEKLPVRTMTDTSLAEAFWKHTVVNEVVPDFDQAMMDGEVELQFASSKVDIHGLVRYVGNTGTPPHGLLPGTAAGGEWWGPNGGSKTVVQGQHLAVDVSTAIPRIWAELAESGATVSLANIELAKKTAAFAKLRERFSGLSEDHVIDLLMEGIRVPDEALKQPILLAKKSTIFGYTERHAMDGENLTESLTTGKTRVNLRFRTPPINTGGVILITAEIVPEQLYERMRDHFLGVSNPAQYPNFMRDYLDPEKVEVVENRHVDVLHSTPTAVFGYAPLNHKWRRSLTRTGGKFARPFPDAFVEDRQRFWSADQVNPTLMDDFYMVSDLPNSVFADTISEPFEILTLGSVSMIGNTVFGPRLSEDIGAYEDIMEDVDTGRITQTPVPMAAAAPAPAPLPEAAPAPAEKKEGK